MAATTFATLAEIAKEEFDRMVITFNFLQTDPVFRNLLLEPTAQKQFTQPMYDAQDTADFLGWKDDFTTSAISYAEYSAHLARIGDQGGVDASEAAILDNPDLDNATPMETQRIKMLESVARKFRGAYLLGQPATVTIGADVTTLGVAAVEPRPRMHTVAEVHGTKATPTARNHLINWVLAAKTLQFKPYGESSYGAAVTLSATKYHRVQLFNSDGTKWIYVTVVWATISVAANFVSDGTDAKAIKTTPNLSPTGFATLCHPNQRWFGNLSQTNPGAVTGDTLTYPALSRLARSVRQQSNGQNGIITLDPDMYGRAQSVLIDMGLGEKIITFMGEELNTLSVGGIPIVESDSMIETRYAPDGTTEVGRILGLIYGGKRSGAHIRYNTISNLEVIRAMPQFFAGGNADTGHGDSIPLPFTFYVVGPDSSNEALTPRASMFVEPATARFGAVSVLDTIKYS
jgi:hypothetical protein